MAVVGGVGVKREPDGASIPPAGAEEGPAPGARRKRRAKRLTLTLLALALLVVALGTNLLAGIGGWLARPDPLPSSADALVAISGDPRGVREEEAARLWREGLAPRVIVSGGPVAWRTVAAEVMREHLIALGVPPEAVQVEPRATSTLENARFTLPMVSALRARTVVVVTSNYHVRRTRLAFRRVYGPQDIQVFVHGTPDPSFDPDGWWRQGGGREYGLLELVKILWYLLPIDGAGGGP